MREEGDPETAAVTGPKHTEVTRVFLSIAPLRPAPPHACQYVIQIRRPTLGVEDGKDRLHPSLPAGP